ncbi:MAG: hypothetical protein PUG10_01345 [Lachnospiraceae bacterium]|nr:hypothetical protein [Lachnospiraceae bacterium]
MINANLAQFLDTGWFNEATLYYQGYTYWCEGDVDKTRDKPVHFIIYKYKSEIHHKENGEIFTTRAIDNGNLIDYSVLIDIYGEDEDEIKEQFLQAKIFDGKSFWEIEDKVAWYDEN